MELYAYIANEYSTTGIRVERAIRTAIQHTARSPEAAQMFDTILCYEKEIPANSDFLFTLADEFKQKPIKRKEKKAVPEAKPETPQSVIGGAAIKSDKVLQFLEADANKVEILIQNYPVNMPTAAAADFLGLDVASLRSAIENGVVGMSWRKAGKANHAYFIPTAQFVRWYLNIKS